MIMSFQQSTYEKALQAIAHDDVAGLKRLISKEVDDDGVRHRSRMRELVRQAAERGLGEAVEHLASRVVLREDHYRQQAWVNAIEAGQTNLADAIFYAGGRTVPRFPARARFNLACREHAWAAAQHLVEVERYPPDDTDLMIVFSEMRDAPVDDAVRTAWAPWRTWGQRVGPDSLDDVLIVAMRRGDETLFADALTRINMDCLDPEAGALLDQARQSDRYDWAKALDQRRTRGWSDGDWVEGVIAPAVTGGQLRFVEDALEDRPSLVNKIRQGHGAAQFLGYRLVVLAQDDDEPELQVVQRRLLNRMYPGELLTLVRDQIEATNDPQGQALNRLALWAPEAVRDRWLQEEPVTFGPAIAVMREAQASSSSATARAHRGRCRA